MANFSVHKYVIAIDLGTTGNRAFLFDSNGDLVQQVYKELTQYYPQPGWVEHDPQEIWDDARWTIQTLIQKTGINPKEVASIGLTVQRETCLIWNRRTGKPIGHAIVWQDRRTADQCTLLKERGKEQEIYDKTGLILDAYFSATKLKWLIDSLKNSQTSVAMDDLICGTIDSWVLWNLTAKKVHATDPSNASRTMLMNLETLDWDDDLLSLFDIPKHFMPTIQPSLSFFGMLDPKILGTEIPITAILGDQQASLYGHGCNRTGMLKCTYGTGCFLVAFTDNEIARSQHQLISTVAWTSKNTQPNFALEGSMFTTGSCVQWLRDGLNIIKVASETEALAQSIEDNAGLYFVPALSGLGAPHWDMSARGSFFGITGGIRREHFARAVLEAIAYQVYEVVALMNNSLKENAKVLKVDGGACENNFLMQYQADLLGIPIERPVIKDITVQGAAFASGVSSGFWSSYESLVGERKIDRVFEPSSSASSASEAFHIWKEAVERSKKWRI
jgi:glycerol kinase